MKFLESVVEREATFDEVCNARFAKMPTRSGDIVAVRTGRPGQALDRPVWLMVSINGNEMTWMRDSDIMRQSFVIIE